MTFHLCFNFVTMHWPRYVTKSYLKQVDPYCRFVRKTLPSYSSLDTSSLCFKTLGRHFHRHGVSNTEQKQLGMLRNVGNTLKWYIYLKAKRNVSSVLIYEACADNIDIKEFFSYFKMPDTFLSWFLIIELHVWMCMARMMAEKAEGRYVRNQIVVAMWEDVQTRIKKLGDVGPSVRKEGVQELADHFNAALLSYDEGLQGDDTVLAAAVWRIFFCYNCDDPCLLETLVSYIRKQVFYLESLSLDQLLAGDINWILLQNAIASH